MDPPLTLSEVEKLLPLASLANLWVRRVQSASPRRAARDLYVGRAFQMAKKVAESLDGSLHIVSAGCGFVSEHDSLPNYSLTVADGEGSIASLLKAKSALPSDWWYELTSAMGAKIGLRQLLSLPSSKLVLLALPASYLGLVAEEFDGVSANQLEDLRIFTSTSGRKHVPAYLKHAVMPYDERLEAVPGIAGTRSDFAQRAMWHFVASLKGNLLDIECGHAAVEAALQGIPLPIKSPRAKVSDAKIRELILINWDLYGGSSGQLLRHLRDKANVACEQKRFQGLWRTIKDERLQLG